MLNHEISHIFRDCGCQVLEKLLPRVVLVPTDEAAITRLVKIAAEHRVRICATGAGSSFPTDYSPRDDQVFLLTTQMNQIMDLRYLDAVVLVETGMLASELARRLEGTDLELPPAIAVYPGTIGGAVLGPDTSGGRHAEIRRRLLGLELIDPMGRHLSYGSSAIKNVAGYDYWTFLVGTSGRFGVLTQLTFNLEKMPELGQAVEPQKSCDREDSPNHWIFANLCKELDPDGIFVP
jgi:FAD/FMN-containing dehydrogenase